MELVNESQAKERLLRRIRSLKREVSSTYSPRYRGISDPLARYLEIEVKEGELPNHDGMYSPDPLRIIIDPSSSQERVNFSFFHEITHHLIRGDDVLYSFINEYSSEEHLTESIEKFCDIGAAEFLMPRSDIQAAIATDGFSLQLLTQFDKQYSASKPAIIVQLAECAPHKCILVICEYGIVPHRDLQPSLISGIENRVLFVQFTLKKVQSVERT